MCGVSRLLHCLSVCPSVCCLHILFTCVLSFFFQILRGYLLCFCLNGNVSVSVQFILVTVVGVSKHIHFHKLIICSSRRRMRNLGEVYWMHSQDLSLIFLLLLVMVRSLLLWVLSWPLMLVSRATKLSWYLIITIKWRPTFYFQHSLSHQPQYSPRRWPHTRTHTRTHSPAG